VSAQMRRTSIYSIPPGIQRPGAISQGDIRSELLIPSPRQKECHHVHLYSEAFDECCRGTCRGRCLVRSAFSRCSIRSKQPSRSDFAFALACADRSPAACEGRCPPGRGSVGMGAPATGYRCRTRSQARHLPRLLKSVFPGGIRSSPTASLPSMSVSFRFFRASSIHKPT
jgi:hypothetical protein